MKKLLLTLLLCFGMNAFACDCNCNETPSSLIIEVPEGLKKTWNVTGYEYGVVLDLYEDDEDDLAMVIGKVPLCTCDGVDLESVFPMIIDALGMQKDLEYGNQTFNVEVLPELIFEDCESKRFQFSMMPCEENEGCLLDIHLLFKDGVMHIVATGMSSDVDLDEFLEFTEELLASIYFE